MKWEYLVLKSFLGHTMPYGELSKSLNEYGAEGWEFAGTVTRASLHGVTEELALILQRPVVEPEAAEAEHAAVVTVTVPR